jgi:CRISPR system Cascade subunit CasD
MLAAALGRPPRHANRDLLPLRMTVRVDNPGRPLRDWHTVGGGEPKERTVITAGGQRRGSGLIFEDWYLSGAAFTVALEGDGDVLDTVTRAVARPVYPPHLGRRNCPPGLPVLLWRTTDPQQELADLPLHRPAPPGTVATVRVTYIHDQAPPDAPDAPSSRTLDDDLDDHGRHLTRPVWDTERDLPAGLCAGWATDWLTAITHRR